MIRTKLPFIYRFWNWRLKPEYTQRLRVGGGDKHSRGLRIGSGGNQAMSGNRPVPIVNSAGEAVTFERLTGGNDRRGTITLRPGDTHYESGVSLTYETLVLKDASGNFTEHVITMDELADDSYEKIEVTHDPDQGFRLKRHRRRTWIQKNSNWNPFKSRTRGGTLPT